MTNEEKIDYKIQSFREYQINKRKGLLVNSRVLIDEVDTVLSELLNVKVDKVTCTPDSINNKLSYQRGYECKEKGESDLWIIREKILMMRF